MIISDANGSVPHALEKPCSWTVASQDQIFCNTTRVGRFTLENLRRHFVIVQSWISLPQEIFIELYITLHTVNFLQSMNNLQSFP